ncbi:hypothetical protein MUN81_09840 [Hymenobacter sp. 5317J-9]|uniref:hypothetical protein n=1 Tax=Hymenobacter sp. 5317J-9 TaxID=2932250 RepID=UPI001FD6C579|nr:hypothetical protein [Hymenobacter sp. 5317J-9]UOQ99781.1 hypothetical protein MUN81_09840 [Hymenobacter sp. 5317J-9]
MKNYVFPRFIALLLLLAGAATAQAQSATVSTAGYWNLETNLTTHDYTLVRFYNAQDQLVYQERIDGLCLNLNSARPLCRKTAAKLNLALQQVLDDPGLGNVNTALVAQQLSADRRVQRVYAVR